MNNGLNVKRQSKESKLVSKMVWGLIICIIAYIVYVSFIKKDPKRDLRHKLITSGSIKALEEAIIYPRINGKLQKNILKEGDSVKKDQTISLIDRDEVGAKYEPVVVPSTLSGVVAKIYRDPGENVTTQTPIALVVNQSILRIKVDVPERYVGEIYKGQVANLTVDAYPDKKFEAKLDIISPVVDSLSRSVAVEFKATNTKNLLKSGMFTRVDISLKEVKNVLSVSKKSVFEDEDGKYYVLVPSEDSKIAVRKDIEVKFKNNNYWQIAGLREGSKILQFVYGIKDGSKIEIQK